MKRVYVLVVLLLLAFSVGNLIAAGQSEPVAKDKVKVAVIMAGPKENPFDGIIYAGTKKAAEELGVEFAFMESVKPDNYKRVLQDYLDNGYKTVVVGIAGTMAVTKKLAKEYPEAAFNVEVDPKPIKPNISVFNLWLHEPAYLCGMIAGAMSKTGIIGAVGGFSTPDSSVAFNAFKAGAQEINPDIILKVTYIGTWFDPPKAKEAAIALVSAGADSIYADRYGAIDGAKEMGVWGFGHMIDKQVLGKETVLASAVWDFYPAAYAFTKSTIDGTYVAADYADFSYMKNNGSKLVVNKELWLKVLPENIRKLVEKREKEIIAGDFMVPLNTEVPKSE